MASAPNSVSLATPSGPGSAPRPLPEIFGRYRILRALGQGGMGTVYEAHDTQLERRVALKVPRFAEGADSALLQRFRREARIAATFTHPDLCPVYDVGQIDGIHYLTMPVLQGESLSAWLQREGPLPALVAAELTRRLARALQVAHEAGIIHRDLKPSNILIRDDRTPVVMDFGLARRVAGDVRMTDAGAIVGTPAYCAPEQIGGDPELLGPATDVYGLGVVLYEMLAGRLPFEGSMHEVLRQVLVERPAPPSRHRPGIEPRLEAICLTALAKNPQARFASMAAFAAALDEYLREPQGAPPRLPAARPVRRLGRPALLLAAVLGVVLLGVLFWLARAGTSGDALRPGSRWSGIYHFAPPVSASGDVLLTITERSGREFRGTYASEDGDYVWHLAGTIDGETVQWRFTEKVREKIPTGLARAYVEGKCRGKEMALVYREPVDGGEEETATMTLRLQDKQEGER